MEEWRDIIGYEGLYQVSSLGRVRSLDRVLTDGHRRKGRILSSAVKKNGYEQVNLYRGNKQKTVGVHQLVAMAFCDGYAEGYEVNHKDENRLNNHADNLEWLSRKDNLEYSNVQGRMTTAKMQKVEQYSMEGKLIATYDSIREASLATGCVRHVIAGCCKGKYKQSKGFIWKYG